MSDNTKIEWTDATWNPITGCSVVSPGCTNCYAMRLAGTRLAHHPSRAGLTDDSKAGPVWNGQVRFNEQWLTQPLSWKRPRKIFVCAHGDLFHENVPDEWIDKVFAVMALAPQHTFQVLTKHSARMRGYLSKARSHPVGLEALGVTLDALTENPRSQVGAGIILTGDIAHLKVWPLPNVWLGVTCEDQARADERIPDLLATPAAVRFVSAEPLLGPIDLTSLRNIAGLGEGQRWLNALGSHGCGYVYEDVDTCSVPGLDWVIVGGESGPGAWPMHPDWVRSIRDQCKAAGVPFHFKQWGAWSPLMIDGEEDGYLNPAYPMSGCSEPGTHKSGQKCLFWQDNSLVEWPYIEKLPAIGVRLVGKARAGRLLDGVTHDEFPAGGQ